MPRFLIRMAMSLLLKWLEERISDGEHSFAMAGSLSNIEYHRGRLGAFKDIRDKIREICA